MWRRADAEMPIVYQIPAYTVEDFARGRVPMRSGEKRVGDRELAAALQRGAPALEPGLPDAGRVRGEAEGQDDSARASDGAERCGMWSLRAPPRRPTVPDGTNTTNRGGVLKLSVVRRNRAGHYRVGVARRISAEEPGFPVRDVSLWPQPALGARWKGPL